MRIEKIRFKNINSLRGEHLIDFTQEPLISAGLFAIFGPTGSGKSTVLDVITLALYNQIPRSSARISSTKIQEQGAVLTRYEKSANAEVTYLVNSKRFTSRWSIETARTGNLKDYHMEILDQSGQPLDLKRSEVPAKNEALLGLSYDQFIKSVLLSQGEFARFLKANKNDRGELLEKITGTSIYREIGMAAYRKFQEVEKVKEVLQNRLDEVKILPAEIRESLIKERDDRHQFISQTEKSIKVKRTKVQSAEQWLKLQSEKDQLAKVLEGAKDQEKLFESERNRLKSHKTAVFLVSDLERRKGYAETANKLLERKNTLSVRIKEIKKDISSVQMQAWEILGEEVEPVQVEKRLRCLEQKYNQAKAEREDVARKGKLMKAELQKEKLSLKLDLPALPTQALEVVQPLMAEKIKILDTHKIDLDSHSDSLVEEWKKKQDELSQLTDYMRLKKEAEKLNAKIKLTEEGLKNNREALVREEGLLEPNQQLLKSLQNEKAVLEEKKLLELKMASLEKHRSELEEGSPCPLCGAVHHPYTDHALAEENNTISGLEVKTAAIQKQETILRKIERRIAQLAAKIEAEQHSRLSFLTEYKEVNKQIDSHYPALNDKLIEQKDLLELQAEIERLDQSRTALDQYHRLQVVQKRLEELEDCLNDYRERDQIVKSIYPADDLAERVDGILQNLFSYDSLLAENKQQYNIVEKEFVKVRDKSASFLEVLEEKVQQAGFSDIPAAEAVLMSKSEIESLEKEDQRIQSAIQRIHAQLSQINLQINAVTESATQIADLEEYKAGLEIEEAQLTEAIAHKARITQTLHQDDTLLGRMKKLNEEYTEVQGELEKWGFLKKMIGDAKGHVFANYAQSLTLRNLVGKTNMRLLKLSDRYRLEMPDDTDELRVIDLYQGGLSRSVTTLSGGESFILSLALALSLSDLSSQNVRIESLFIDEGFGTLDAETLDIALSTLEKLQSEGGKKVGVISHVPALKERIQVQIQLEKDQQGYSRLEVLG